MKKVIAIGAAVAALVLVAGCVAEGFSLSLERGVLGKTEASAAPCGE